MHEQRHGEASAVLFFMCLFLLLTPALVDRSLFQKTDELGPREVKPMCWLGSDSWNPSVQMKPGTLGVTSSWGGINTCDFEPTTEIGKHKAGTSPMEGTDAAKIRGGEVLFKKVLTRPILPSIQPYLGQRSGISLRAGALELNDVGLLTERLWANSWMF